MDDAIPLDPGGPQELFDAAVDQLMGSVSDAVDVLALGEPLHGAEVFPLIRNRIFRRLVEAHGFTAIALESSFPRSVLVDRYINGRTPGDAVLDDVLSAGFSHGFGRTDASRALVDWMRAHNAHADRPLRFYGFDAPMEMTGTDSPRALLVYALDYLERAKLAGEASRRRRIEELIGTDAAWENPAAMQDPNQSIGLTPAAQGLRVETEELIAELQRRRPALAAATGRDAYLAALQHAAGARHLLTYHAALARPTDDRIATALGLRDLAMADNLTFLAARERGLGDGRAGVQVRGRILVFAHNSHLQRAQARWQLGPHDLRWWPAGAHVHHELGPRYAVVGSAAGISPNHGIAEPETGSLEAHLASAPHAGCFIPTARLRTMPPSVLNDLPVRSGTPACFPLTPETATAFDHLLFLRTLD